MADISKLPAKILEKVPQAISLGIAVINREDLTIVFENENFFKWFPSTGDTNEALQERVPEFDPEKAKKRLEKGRSYSFETKAVAGGHDLPIRVELKVLSEDSGDQLLLEAEDLSKQKRAEYMLESYSKMAEKNARELSREKDRVERLLLNIMPKAVYEEMKDYGTVSPQLFESASILMVDFVGHTEKDIAQDPAALVTEINDIFTVFDRITDLFACERIRTVGDAYMAVSGLPEAHPDHAHNIARVALRMLRYIERRNETHSEPWLCRIGINTGPVIGSLVGVQKYVYDIFGPGVNMAARMETLSEPMQITISENTFQLIKDEFECEERGQFEVKGFGTQELYFLTRELPHN